MKAFWKDLWENFIKPYLVVLIVICGICWLLTYPYLLCRGIFKWYDYIGTFMLALDALVKLLYKRSKFMRALQPEYPRSCPWSRNMGTPPFRQIPVSPGFPGIPRRWQRRWRSPDSIPESAAGSRNWVKSPEPLPAASEIRIVQRRRRVSPSDR